MVNLTSGSGDYHSSIWSPDGKHIAFLSAQPPNIGGDIHVADLDGSNPVQITSGYESAFLEWSPDGKHLAFDSFRDRNFDIYVVDINGSHSTNLTNNPTNDSGARWSPDGQHIAFESNRSGIFKVYIMDADGSNLTDLGLSIGGDSPAWSPDGSSIAFSSLDKNNSYEIYVVDINGQNLRRLTNGPTDSSPA